MRPAEDIKRLIKKLNDKTSAQMDERVLKDVVCALEETEKTSAPTKPNIRSKIMKNPIIKYAAVIAVVLGLGAISVVGVNIGKYYYYMGRNDDGAPIFRSEDFNVTVTLDDDEITDVEQAQRYLEEMKVLSEQGKKELLKVEEMMTDGTLEMKVYVYRYELSDGRIIDQREGGSEGAYALGGTALWQEWRQLNKAGPGEDLGIEEKIVEGHVFSFKREKYILSDGTEIVWSVGTPKKN
jgi:hypothetical protein